MCKSKNIIEINNHIEKILTKHKILNNGLMEISASDYNKTKIAYILKLEDNSYRLYIPDNIKGAPESTIINRNLEKVITKSRKINKLEVIGGTQLEEADYLLAHLEIEELDLSKFCTPLLSSMDNLFTESKINKVDLSCIDTSQVESMQETFCYSNFKEIDISDWDLRSLTTSDSMFQSSKIEKLILGKHQCKKLTDTKFMFDNTITDIVDLHNWSIPNLETYHHMFDSCKAKKIYLPNTNIKLENIAFRNCKSVIFG